MCSEFVQKGAHGLIYLFMFLVRSGLPVFPSVLSKSVTVRGEHVPSVEPLTLGSALCAACPLMWALGQLPCVEEERPSWGAS